MEKYSQHKESETASPYDLGADSNGVWIWHPCTVQYTSQHPLALPIAGNDEEFDAVIQSILEQFKHFIEEAGGWRLLWNDDEKEKPESAAQLLFRGIAENYCRAANIVVDREVEFGRGPVDFKFSRGYSNRALIEAKKVHNGKFWNGLSEQLPSYLNSDKCQKGWFLAIQYRSSRSTIARIRDLSDTVHKLNLNNPDIEMHSFVVDGRPKISASKL